MSKKQVNLYVDAKTKDEWASAVSEEAEYESLSQLVRLGVERELQGDHDQPEQTRGGQAIAESDLTEILSAVQRIERTVDDLDVRLRALEQESQSDSDVYDLQQVVFSTLPTPPEVSEADRMEGEGPYSPAEWAVSVEEIANRIGAEEADVREALDRLTETSQVKRGAGTEGTPRFYKRE